MSSGTRRMTSAALLAVTATLVLSAPTANAQPARLPTGVIQLGPGEPCPFAALCLHRDHQRGGPAYGIGAGHDTNLNDLPLAGHLSPSAAGNVSSWVNHTHGLAVLIDQHGGVLRPLLPGQSLEEPSHSDDTVDHVIWID
jgi:hypothetical protein